MTDFAWLIIFMLAVAFIPVIVHMFDSWLEHKERMKK